MILVDTSVWIRSLAGRTPYPRQLGKLLALDAVIGHELVYGELLVGDRGMRRKLLADYERLPQARMIPHREVVEFVLRRNLHGRDAGWTDVHLLASALVARVRLWTADLRLSALAEEVGVGYETANWTGPLS